MKTLLFALTLCCSSLAAQTNGWMATVEAGVGLRPAMDLGNPAVYGFTIERQLVSRDAHLALWGGVGTRLHTLTIMDEERQFTARSTAVTASVALRYELGRFTLNCRALPAYRVADRVVWTTPIQEERFSNIDFRGRYNSRFDLDLGIGADYLVTKRVAIGLNLMVTPVRRGVTLSEERYICPFAPPCYVWEDYSVSEVRTAVTTLSAQVAYRF